MSVPRPLPLIVLCAVMLTIHPNSAFGVEGVVEINATRAAAGGVTSGDTPGFPVTLTSPGSYRLTGPLSVPDGDTTAIDIQSEDVHLDLAGFALRGPVDCRTQTCGNVGTGAGILVRDQRVTIRNGRVVGFGGNGIDTPSAASSAETIVVDVHASSNGGDGIVISTGRVEGSLASFNGGSGIRYAGQALVTSNVTQFNQRFGIESQGGEGVIRDNVVRANDQGGMSVSFAPLITGNTVINSQKPGIIAGGAHIESNTLSGNSPSIRCVLGSCNVVGNTITGGGTLVEQVGTPVRFGDNFISGPTCPPALGGLLVYAGANTCL